MRLLLITLAALPLGCGSEHASSEPAPPSEGHIVFEHGGLEREYLLYLPPEGAEDGKGDIPLLLSFHGFLSDMDRQREISGVEEATARGMAVAFPNGLQNSWDAGECCAPPDPERDDLAFVEALIADIAARTPVDPARIHATGMSNGAAFAHRLACQAPSLIASAGPVASRLRVPETSCISGAPRSIVHFHGTTDTIASYDDARDQLAGWAARNGCEEPMPQVLLETAGATCDGYASCDEGVQVVFCSVSEMGHCWPGNPECETGTASTALSANDVMLDVFAGAFP